MFQIDQPTLNPSAIRRIREEWQTKLLSTQPLVPAEVRNDLNQACQFLQQPLPTLVFCESPRVAFQHFCRSEYSQALRRTMVEQLRQCLDPILDKHVGRGVLIQIDQTFFPVLREISRQLQRLVVFWSSPLKALVSQLEVELLNQVPFPIYQQLLPEFSILSAPTQQFLDQYLQQIFHDTLLIHLRQDWESSSHWDQGQTWPSYQGQQLREWVVKEIEKQLLKVEWNRSLWEEKIGVFTYCVQELGCHLDPVILQISQELSRSTGWIFGDPDTLYICERPQRFCLDEQGRFHSATGPACQFSATDSFYALRGVIIPPRFGAVPPEQWDLQSILQESNAEVKRVLIQEVGYEVLVEKLKAIVLNHWGEYSLLRLENVDTEPMHLLKMTCPSTQHVHVLRVPPSMTTAQEAIRWINWGIRPSQFRVQT